MRKLHYLLPIALAVASVALVTGCDGTGSERSWGSAFITTQVRPIRAAATTGMVADLVRNVGGPHVDVGQLMGDGVDPHLYKPAPGDVRLLIGSDIVFYSGLDLEGKMGEVFEQLARRKPTVAVADSLPRDLLLPLGEAQFDPHVWMDVRLWSLAAAAVRDALSELAPEHAGDFQEACAKYQAELARLDQESRETLAAIPESRRVLVTAHDAFEYFGRAYDVEVRSIQGVSTESEASVLEMNALVDFLVRRKVAAVFVESSVSDRYMRALLEGCQARGHRVRFGGELYSDAMGPAGTPEATYIGMMRHNVQTIARGLAEDGGK